MNSFISRRTEREINNPADWRELKIYTLVSLPFFAIGIVIALIGWPPVGTIIFLAVGAETFLLPVHAELIARPKKVRIQNDGVVMFLPGRRPRFVRWREIRMIEARAGDKKSFMENTDRGGLMRLRGLVWFIPVRLTYEAALAIKAAYDARTSGPPPCTEHVSIPGGQDSGQDH